MEHLPKNALANVAAYLDKTSRALLAVALTAPSSSWKEWDTTKSPSRASKIVMSSPYHSSKGLYKEKWDKLDLCDVNGTAHKLTDADVFGILVCIDAVNKVKKLWLTDIMNVVGNGLAPLRGSTKLEHFVLSQKEYRGSPAGIYPTYSLSEDKVLPILQSIIDQDGASLNHLCLPKSWREVQSKELGLLLEAYNCSLNRRNIACSKCDKVCLGTHQRPWMPVEGRDFGVQNFTCHHCMHKFCSRCEVDNNIIFCACCEEKFCASCATMNTCGDCHTTTCAQFCENFYTCDICNKTQCDGCYCGTYCDSCKRATCAVCTHAKCKLCGESICIECLNSDVGHEVQCPLCDEAYCSNGGKMNHCFRIGCDMCLNCHIVKCYWRALPTKLQKLLPEYSNDISNDSLVRFWKECTAFVGTDKEYDLSAYKEARQATLSSFAIAIDYLLKDKNNEAVYMMFYAGFVGEICLRGPDYVVKLLEKKSAQPNSRIISYLNWFYNMIHDSQTQKDIVSLLGEKLSILVQEFSDAKRLKDMLDKVPTSKSKIHCVEVISDEVLKEEISPIYGDSIVMDIFFCNSDCQKCSANLSVYKDITLGWLMKLYIIKCNYHSKMRSPKITPSTKYFRIVHKGKTFFLSSSGKKTLYELGVRDGDTVTVGGVDSEDSNRVGGSTNKPSTKKGASKSKQSKKRSGPKKKKKPQAPSTPLLTEDEIMEKHRETHSRAMSRVLEELNPLLKGIRNQLNSLTLLKSAPKARTSITRKNSQNQSSVRRALLDEDSLGIGGKAGKIYCPVLVGDVANLYKTNKSSSTRRPTTIDLHGLSKVEALAELDKNLPVWVDVAMRGEYPWVISVDIICGGGSQILSEAVKAWIRSKPQVANRPKNKVEI